MNEYTPLPEEFVSTAAEFTAPQERFADPTMEYAHIQSGSGAVTRSNWRATLKKLLATGAMLAAGWTVLGNGSASPPAKTVDPLIPAVIASDDELGPGLVGEGHGGTGYDDTLTEDDTGSEDEEPPEDEDPEDSEASEIVITPGNAV